MGDVANLALQRDESDASTRAIAFAHQITTKLTAVHGEAGIVAALNALSVAFASTLLVYKTPDATIDELLAMASNRLRHDLEYLAGDEA